MSKFFEALQQAERDRALREQGTGGGPAAEPAATPVDAPRDDVPVSPASRTRARPAPPEGDGGATPLWTAAPEADVESFGQVDGHLVSLLKPTGFGAEQYRTLRYVVEERHKSDGMTVVAVASPGLEDGKTTTAINLAGALAQAPESRVLLIEADLRRPSLMKYLGLDGVNGPGLVDVILRRDIALEAAVRRCVPFNLAIVPAGKSPSATYEVLKSPRLAEILAEARRQYDYVVVDTPPVCPIPDGRVVVNRVDGVLLVACAHKTPRKLIEEALELLPAPPIAIVFNGDDNGTASYYSEYGPPEPSPRWPGFFGRRRRQAD